MMTTAIWKRNSRTSVALEVGLVMSADSLYRYHMLNVLSFHAVAMHTCGAHNLAAKSIIKQGVHLMLSQSRCLALSLHPFNEK